MYDWYAVQFTKEEDFCPVTVKNTGSASVRGQAYIHTGYQGAKNNVDNKNRDELLTVKCFQWTFAFTYYVLLPTGKKWWTVSIYNKMMFSEHISLFTWIWHSAGQTGTQWCPWWGLEPSTHPAGWEGTPARRSGPTRSGNYRHTHTENEPTYLEKSSLKCPKILTLNLFSTHYLVESESWYSLLRS